MGREDTGAAACSPRRPRAGRPSAPVRLRDHGAPAGVFHRVILSCSEFTELQTQA